MEVKTTEQAREYFKNKKIDYSILNKTNRDYLRQLVSEELEKQNKGDGTFVKIRQQLKSDLLTQDSKTIMYNISCKGSWFDKRQGITFQRDGFIGFAGWSGSYHVEPFIKAFIKWCDVVSFEPVIILKAIPAKNGCKGCIGFYDCKKYTKIANNQEGLETCTGRKIIYVEVEK